MGALLRENNQLKSELSTCQLELEQLESRFALQVDEYELEIESMSNKMRDKETTVKNLITSAEEKDQLIVKLKSALIAINGDNNSECTLQAVDERRDNESDENLSENDRESVRQRKIVGLLKLIQDKNQQIESLKCELSQAKEALTTGASNNTNNGVNSNPNSETPMLMSSSTSDLNTSFTNSSSSRVNASSSFSNSSSASYLRVLLESLEKEIQIYQRVSASINKYILLF